MSTNRNAPRQSTYSRREKPVEPPPRKTGGERARRPAIGGLARGWFANHLDISVASLMRLLSSPLQTITTFMVVAVAVCTPLLVLSFAQSVEDSVARLDATTDVSLYLQTSLPASGIQSVRATLESRQDIDGLVFISAEQGLQEFQSRTGLSEILDNLNENPIPAMFTLSVVPELSRDTSALTTLSEELRQIPLVDKVVFDYAWVERLQALILFMNRMVLVLAVLLGGGVVLILGNTIRLEIENRRDEIVIVKLVGGTNSFVRRPLLYAGFWYGVMGGLIGWVLANLGVAVLDQPLGDLSRLYISNNFGLRFLDLWVLAITVVFGAIFGLAGAWLAVGRHLYSIEPR